MRLLLVQMDVKGEFPVSYRVEDFQGGLPLQVQRIHFERSVCITILHKTQNCQRIMCCGLDEMNNIFFFAA